MTGGMIESQAAGLSIGLTLAAAGIAMVVAALSRQSDRAEVRSVVARLEALIRRRRRR